ncbi:MAG: lipopolysaccharide assembly protein LapA domain-containing protein [Candidatus Neomarinimicrobiota bacterium]|nr:MAG: hypothetical protein CBE34_02050 [bacterium TMED274]|tara:strand:- start:111 stop:422 length:312 start_codon:yes stop_codon:yes gene_type:complete
MFRILRVLILLGALGGTYWLFHLNMNDITIYFFKNDITLPGFIFYIIFIMIGVVLGYVISLKSVFSYRSEISNLVKTNKEISEELDSLRNVAVGEEFSFTEKE